MTTPFELIAISVLGFLTTSSFLLGAAIRLYVRFPRRILAVILAFAAGSLISALAIELAFESALQLHRRTFAMQYAWAFVGGGFVLGAIIYYCATLFLEHSEVRP